MERMLSEERTAFLERDFYQGFVKTCGFKLDLLERGRAKSSLKVTEAHSQQDDFVHAGVMATMADHTAGYAAFSVNPARVNQVIKYIGNQSEHHKKTLFKKEFVDLLRFYNIEVNEKYLWG